jgi:hypothetical protein
LSKSQKDRISSLQEENNSLHDKLEMFEIEADTYKKIVSKLMEEKCSFKLFKGDLEQQLDEKFCAFREKDHEKKWLRNVNSNSTRDEPE